MRYSFLLSAMSKKLHVWCYLNNTICAEWQGRSGIDSGAFSGTERRERSLPRRHGCSYFADTSAVQAEACVTYELVN